MLKLPRHSPSRAAGRAGFTLLELSVVVFLIGVIAAIAAPRLIPVIAFSELEGTARHVAGYGQGAMAHSALLRERVVVRVDLDAQEMFAVHWIYPETDEEKALAEEPDQLAKFAALRDQGIRSKADLAEKMLQGGELSSLLGGDKEFDLDLAGYQMDDRFNAFTRKALEARAANVKHNADFLADAGNILGEENTFVLDAEEPEEEELADPVLRRMRPRGDARITGVEIDGEYLTRGVAEIEFSVLGLSQHVAFHIENGEDAYTVIWDPVQARTRMVQGLEYGK